MPENHAIKSAQFTQPTMTEAVGYYEPNDLQELNQRGRLYLVADGTWGTAHGAIAGQYAVHKILYDFYHQSSEPDVEKRLLAVIQKTNQAIYQQNQQQPERRPLATTIMAALIHQDNLIIANVGDNQAYIVLNEKKITPLELPSTAALGLMESITIEITQRRLFPGETLVMSSGGFRGYLTPKDMSDVITHNPPVAASRQLVRIAQQRGSRDNLAINIIEMLEQDVRHTPPARIPSPEPITWEAVLTPPQQRVAPTTSATPSSDVSYVEEGEGYSAGRWLWVAAAVGLLLLACIGLGSWGWSAMNPTAAVTPIAAQTSETTAAEFIIPTDNMTATTSTAATPTATAQTSNVEPTPTERLAIDDLAATTPAATPTATTVPSPTPIPTVVLPPGCTNGARFLDDSSIPDGTEIVAGQPFNKAWSMTNNGTCPWGSGYTMRLIDGDSMQTIEQFDMPFVEPEVITDVTIPLIAPTVPGRYRGTWQMHGLDGEPFGAEVNVEIEVVAPEPGEVVINPNETTLFDFVAQASEATWQSSEVATYQPESMSIDNDLVIPAPAGIVVIGATELRGRRPTDGDVLMTHPHQETNSIEGSYTVAVPLQPTDKLVATLGLPQVAIMNRDGVIFTVMFQPENGQPLTLLSETVTYQDSPQSYTIPLEGVPAGASGTVILQAESGADTSFDWALWIDLRLIREQ